MADAELVFDIPMKPDESPRKLAQGGIEVPPDVLENISQEQMERHNIHTGNETFDEIPEGTLVTPARSKRSA